MRRKLIVLLLATLSLYSNSQERSFKKLLSDSSMIHASVSMYVTDMDNGIPVIDYNSGISLTPASVMKLITSAASLELLGPQYTFKTVLGYTGKLNKRSGKLTGDIVITGGGDPTLGSEYFGEYFREFISSWVSGIKKLGIKKVKGRVITDDSYFDFNPVPAKWLTEDEGNYYGAGVYGLSVFDNTYEIHFNTLDSNNLFIKEITPIEFCTGIELNNRLAARGTTDEGYIFSVPYGNTGTLEGTIPVNKEDFVLKGSITDPPLLIAKILNDQLVADRIIIAGEPSTVRSEQKNITGNIVKITETVSPPLSQIIKVLNHESVNLYAEHLIKELGKKFKNTGSTAAGVEVIKDFLKSTGISNVGMFIEDGSGLSPVNSINTKELVNLLIYMRNKGRYFMEYYNSLPDAGKDGTLKNYFKDPVFDTRLKAKSGSMTRVRSYSGYFTTLSGKQLAFGIIINNYSGPSRYIISEIEDIIKEIILNK